MVSDGGIPFVLAKIPTNPSAMQSGVIRFFMDLSCLGRRLVGHTGNGKLRFRGIVKKQLKPRKTRKER